MDKYKKNKQEKDGSQSHDKTSHHQSAYQIWAFLPCMVIEKYLTKNVILQSTDGKKIGQIQGKISRRKMVPSPTIQQVILNKHTKYENSSLHGSWEIFDENVILQSMEGKKIGQIQERISRRRLGHHQPAYQICAFYLTWLMRNLWWKMSFFKEWKERKLDKNRKE